MNLGTTILGIVIIFSGFFLAYFGMFDRIEVEIREFNGGIIIFEEVRGGYAQTEVVAEELYYTLKNEFGVETRRGYSKYQISPKEAEKNNSLSEVGVFLEKENLKGLVDLEKEFNLKNISDRQYITTDFPFRNSFSNTVGLRKVYPAFDEFVEANGYDRNTPVIEINDTANGKIIYLKEMRKL